MSKTKKITKNTVIKAIKNEYLIPGNWEHQFNKEGENLRSSKKQREKNCAVCAVGAVIMTAKKKGNIKSFKYNIDCSDTNHISMGYLKVLAEGGCYLTALSDYFESMCEQSGIHGFQWKSDLELICANKIFKETGYKDIDFIHITKSEVEAAKMRVKECEKEMKKIKRKLIKFVEKNFPYYIPLKNEPLKMKEKVLKNTPYGTQGEHYGTVEKKIKYHEEFYPSLTF